MCLSREALPPPPARRDGSCWADGPRARGSLSGSSGPKAGSGRLCRGRPPASSPLPAPGEGAALLRAVLVSRGGCLGSGMSPSAPAPALDRESTPGGGCRERGSSEGRPGEGRSEERAPEPPQELTSREAARGRSSPRLPDAQQQLTHGPTGPLQGTEGSAAARPPGQNKRQRPTRNRGREDRRAGLRASAVALARQESSGAGGASQRVRGRRWSQVCRSRCLARTARGRG